MSTERQRIILSMTLGGMTARQISDAIAISVGAVRDARSKLREMGYAI